MDATKQQTKGAEEAPEWWVAMQGNPSPATRAAYVNWLRESPAHVAEMLHICHLYVKLKHFGGWAHIPIKDATSDDEAER